MRATRCRYPGVAPGEVRCWGSNTHGQSTPPGVSQGVSLPWRAWPALPDVSGSGLAALSARATGQCALTSGVAAGEGGRGRRNNALVAALLVASASAWTVLSSAE